MMNDMFQGAEAYLEMWERADGVPATSCLPARARFSKPVWAGRCGSATPLRPRCTAAGQPLSRPGRSYRYCASGASGRGARTASVFNAAGRVALIGTTAKGDTAGGIGAGASTARLKRGATRLASGLWEGRRLAGGARYVYGVRGGRVRYVAVAGAAELRKVSGLRSDIRAAGL